MSVLKRLISGAAIVTALVSVSGSVRAENSVAVDSLVVPSFVVDGGDTLWLAPPLEVVGSRVPAALPLIVRQIEILGGPELERLPGRSAAELLQAVPGVVTGQRQQYGVQSDLTIRGSTFEQVQVLLDGFDVSDAQTGHHALDLPLSRHDIERVEVLKGQGSALYGSGSFGGVVNIVGKRAGARDGGEVAVTGGGLGIRQVRGDLIDVSRQGRTGLRLSFDRFHADGQDLESTEGPALNNESDLWSLTGRLDHQGDAGETAFFIGWSKRKFGALDFYAPYPSRERTETLFGSVRINRRVSDRWTLEPRAYFRRHTDLFVLFEDNPSAYTNDHVGRRIGMELRGIGVMNRNHTLAFGLEGVYDDLDSQGIRSGVEGPAMGRHLRRRISFSTEVDRHTGRLRWQLGARLDARPEYSPRTSGTGALAYDLNENLTVRSSTGSVFRIPTWTELNYTSPANLGDSNLRPEQGWAWDLGLDWRRDSWLLQTAYFERYEEDVIDWALAPGETTFRVLNIAEATVRGVETGATWHHSRGHRLQVSWAWLEKDSELPAGYVARYSLQSPRQVLTGRGTWVLPWNLAATVTGRYLERSDGAGSHGGYRVAFVLDGRLDWEGPHGLFASAAGTNLTDRDYEEIPGVAMPGATGTLSVGQRF